MRICKYCKKPISDDDQVWNPDDEGNGYHNACLCEMEFESRDKQIYDKGRKDALDKLRVDINILAEYVKNNPVSYTDYQLGFDFALKLVSWFIDESEK